jgi:hypothetical protein
LKRAILHHETRREELKMSEKKLLDRPKTAPISSHSKFPFNALSQKGDERNEVDRDKCFGVDAASEQLSALVSL